MIRKPTDQDFQEGTAVTVLRETKRTAVESGNGVGRGVQTVGRFYLYGVFWFGILTTAIQAMLSGMVWQGLVFIGGFYGLQQLIRKGFKKSVPFLSGGKPAPPAPPEPAELFVAARQQAEPAAAVTNRNRQSGDFKLAFPVAMRQAMTLGIPGLILLFLSLAMGVFAFVPGIVLFGTAVLIVLKAVADRDLLHFDHRSITVNNLLGKGTLDWDKVADISARSHSRWNLKVLVTIGTRRAIAVSSLNEQSAVTELLIPIDLLDLDKEGLTALVADLICCRAAAGEIVPSWQEPAVTQPGPITLASDPRESFDPDAIMARYMAERERTIAEVRPDLSDAMAPRQTTPQKAFGRKAA